LLLGVLHGLIRVVLCLIDALLELVTVLRGCRPRGLHGLVDLGLKIFELCGKVHRCSFRRADADRNVGRL
jgi:hypothetical protein